MRRALVATVLLAAAAAAPAHADTVVRGAVVRVEAAEIYLNLGTRGGVAPGARLRLKRPIHVRHPVTRAWVRDWLPLGTAEVTHAGDRLTMAVLDRDLLARVAVGDIAEVYIEREEDTARPPPPPPADEPPPEPEAPLPAVDADTAALLAAWTAQQGQPLPARIRAWEAFLADHPASPHAEAIAADLDLLRELAARIAPTAPGGDRVIGGVEHRAPSQAVAATPLPLVFVLADPDAIAGAWLHYRAGDATTYRRVWLRREGDRYLRAEIPADAVAGPTLEYFVEAFRPDGEAGTAVPPVTVQVPAEGLAARFAPRRRRTRVATSAMVMDFATFAPADDTGERPVDRFWQLESDVTYALDGPIAALGVGFGMIHGEGGFVDPAVAPPRTGFEYGYADVELRLGARAGAAVRLIAGVDEVGLAMGFEGRARIGAAEGTHLALSASTIDGVGSLSQVRFQIDPIGRVPIGLAVGVTDRPAGGELAARLGVDVGLRTSPWFEPVFRLSYQGRTVEHSGLGAGLGLAFHW